MKKLYESVSYLQERGVKNPKLGIVLGTGLGNLIDLIDIELKIN